ncbi:MAG: hypothetical protein LAC70_05610 [Methylovulum sp.]|jgi:hypothetical protein|nr:hypothetical protein [Methylovulum sp.]TSA42207.1 MAG: hypothetical protein D4R63_00985 [Methylococcaceae bacterium]
MIQLKKIALALALTLSTLCVPAFAEEATKNTGLTDTITHVEEALAEIKKSDFSAARLHLKAARTSAATVAGNEAVIKEATNGVIQSQISANTGDVEKASAQLTKALDLFKSL